MRESDRNMFGGSWEAGSLLETLRCPCPRRERLTVEPGPPMRLACSRKDCACGCSEGFPTVDGQPVLIDFAQSVLTEDDVIATGANRLAKLHGGGLRQRLRAFLLGGNRVAEGNCRRLLALAEELSRRPVVLVIGGGTIGTGMAALYQAPQVRLLAFDIYPSPHTQFIADAHALPIAEGAVDAVWIQGVLLHLPDPEKVVAEIHRVLREDGIVYSETPFMQQVSGGPYDFVRYTNSGHRWLFRYFKHLDSGPITGPGAVLVWAIKYFVGGCLRSPKIGTAISSLFFWLRYFDRLMPRGYMLDGASGVFFLGRRATDPLTLRELVAYYQGAQR